MIIAATPPINRKVPHTADRFASFRCSFLMSVRWKYRAAIAKPPKVRINKGNKRRGTYVSRRNLTTGSMADILGYLIGILTLVTFGYFEGRNLFLATIFGIVGIVISGTLFLKAGQSD